MNYYLLFKSLHLIAIISWMVGLLYLPRIFVYHVENYHKKETSDIFKTMERKLYYYIMLPAMTLSWIFGLVLFLIIGPDFWSLLWVKVKFIFIVLLTIYHFYLSTCLEKLKNGQNTKSSKFFRIINEIPTLLLILIIFVVIFKPI